MQCPGDWNDTSRGLPKPQGDTDLSPLWDLTPTITCKTAILWAAEIVVARKEQLCPSYTDKTGIWSRHVQTMVFSIFDRIVPPSAAGRALWLCNIFHTSGLQHHFWNLAPNMPQDIAYSPSIWPSHWQYLISFDSLRQTLKWHPWVLKLRSLCSPMPCRSPLTLGTRGCDCSLVMREKCRT
jgi:hypothetical protein